MGRMNHKRMLWTLNRAYLRHGALVWVSAAGIAIMLLLSVLTVAAALRLVQIEVDQKARVDELRGTPASVPVGDEASALPLPQASRRFDITRRILTSLQKTGFEPEQIRFKFEAAGEAGLTRQIAVFSVKARWDDVARLLAQLQRSDRAIYISKLRVARENAEDELVVAEIQIAVALLDDTDVPGAAP